MNIVQSVKQAIWAKYQTSTLYTADHVALYLDHVPASVTYPIICVYAISSNNFMAMPTAVKTEGFDYIDSRFQFTIYGNDRNHVQMEDIADRLETLYHRQSLIMPIGSNVSHIATISLNQRTMFYDQKIKVWTLNTDYRILAGK
jgi:hypothetical protein